MEKETIEYKGYKIETFYEEGGGFNPRQDDNLGTMACFHNRYTLGDDEIGFSCDDFDGWDEMEKHIKNKLGVVVCLPLYMYDHSQQSISIDSFIGKAHHAEWDSGRIGFIYATKKDIRENWMIKNVTKKLLKHTESILKAEVNTYDQYIQGNVYRYNVEDSEGNHVDSCGGFIGEDYYDDMVEEAKHNVDFNIQVMAEEITGKVTLG